MLLRIRTRWKFELGWDTRCSPAWRGISTTKVLRISRDILLMRIALWVLVCVDSLSKESFVGFVCSCLQVGVFHCPTNVRPIGRAVHHHLWVILSRYYVLILLWIGWALLSVSGFWYVCAEIAFRLFVWSSHYFRKLIFRQHTSNLTFLLCQFWLLLL